MSKFFLEVIQDVNGAYSANLIVDGKKVEGLPEKVNYNTLRDGIRDIAGIRILKKKDMFFESCRSFPGMKFAYIDATQYRGAGKDCRVTLPELYRGWRPKFEDPIVGDKVFIYPGMSDSTDFETPCILGGTVLERVPGLDVIAAEAAPTVTIHITDKFYPNGAHESMDETYQYYDWPSLYDHSLEAAQEKAAHVYEKIDAVKSLPRTVEHVEPYYGYTCVTASNYFKVIDVRALSDEQLVVAKDLASDFEIPEAIRILNVELKERFIKAALDVVPQDSHAMTLAEKLGYAKDRAAQSAQASQTNDRNLERG